MSLNANNAPMASNRPKQPLIEVGSYPGRVVQVIDLGLQAQSFQGEDKPPCQEVMVGYELVDEFCKDEEGNDLPDKPRWLSERFTLKNLKIDKAKSTIRYNAIDPTGVAKGDFTKIVNFPCIINVIVENGRGANANKEFNRVGSVAAMRAKDAEKLPPLANDPVVFTLDKPDMDMFNGFPEWVQNVIKDNLNFRGSPLDVALGGEPVDDEASDSPEPDWKD